MDQKRPGTFLQWMSGGRYVWWRWGIAYLVIVPSAVALFQLWGWIGVVVVIVPAFGYVALMLTVETLVYHPRCLSRGPMFVFLPFIAWAAAMIFSPNDVQSTEYYKAMAQILRCCCWPSRWSGGGSTTLTPALITSSGSPRSS